MKTPPKLLITTLLYYKQFKFILILLNNIQYIMFRGFGPDVTLSVSYGLWAKSRFGTNSNSNLFISILYVM